MPQLDKITFFNQIFYLLFFFFLLYFFMLKYGLPTIVSGLKVRRLFFLKMSSLNQVNKSTSDFDIRFFSLFSTLNQLSKQVVTNISSEIDQANKQLSIFLVQNPQIVQLHKRFISSDLQINSFRFEKISASVRYKEKQKNAQLRFDR